MFADCKFGNEEIGMTESRFDACEMKASDDVARDVGESCVVMR